MKKIFLLLALCLPTIFAAKAETKQVYTTNATDALTGKFTVSQSGNRVVFSKGNLQAKTTDKGAHWTWSIAANQWDYIGNAAANNAINGNSSVSASGTVDLFGWSTEANYYGIHVSTSSSAYSGKFKEWGEKIGTGWRTLTGEEWEYVLYGRPNADQLRAPATVNEVHGLVLLPDDADPTALGFTTDMTLFSDPSSWTINNYTANQWNMTMQPAGAVFLPAAGERNGKDVTDVADQGYYWSSTGADGDAIYLLFSWYGADMIEWNGSRGSSVRLVQNTTPLQAYTVYKDGVLTYYYDDKMDSRTGDKELYKYHWEYDIDRFEGYIDQITKAVIDPSFKNARRYSLANMFGSYINSNKLVALEEIEGLDNIDFSEVVDLYSMFTGCEKLKSIDLSAFNTDKVDMMRSLFSGCESLTSLDLSTFNTENVKDMCAMFGSCKSLTSLDLTMFKTEKVEDMSYMFDGCSALETIYCAEYWSESSVLMNSDYMFHGCTSLTGGQGTKCDGKNYIDISYAHPDEGVANPGYFTTSLPKKIYTYYDGDATLTYYCNDQYTSLNGGIIEYYDPVNNPVNVRFQEYGDKVTKAVIDESMKDTLLTSTLFMFVGGGFNGFLTKMASIEGMENLNTEKVTNTGCMFWGCIALESLDLTHFKIDNVTDMSAMFESCSALTTIYCDDDWSESTTLIKSDNMFNGCTQLVGGNGTVYNEDIVDRLYAHPDRNGYPGYFTGNTQGIEQAKSQEPKANNQKLLRDGQILILRGNKTYNAQGAEAK